MRFRRLSLIGSLIGGLSIAIGIGAAWPLRGTRAQPEFFVSLASGVLTVLGIVFALLLLGTQLGSSSGRANSRHAFGFRTWAYLALLLVATTAAFALGYYAKEPASSERPCLASLCVSQDLLARCVISLVIAALIFLIPYARSLLGRVSPRGIFLSDARRFARSRTTLGLLRAVEFFLEDLEFASQDRTSFELGCESLRRAGEEAISKRPLVGTVDAEQCASAVSGLFATLNYRMSERDELSEAILISYSGWLEFVVRYDRQPKSFVFVKRQIDDQVRAEVVRKAVESVISNLRLWSEGPDVSFKTALHSVRLAVDVCQACAGANLRVKFSGVGRQLVAKLSNASPAENSANTLTLRGLITLLREAESAGARVNLGQKSLWVSCEQAIKHLAEDHELSRSIGPWALLELHRVIDMACASGFEKKKVGPILKWAPQLRNGQFSNLMEGHSGRGKCKTAEAHKFWLPEVLNHISGSTIENWNEALDVNVRDVTRSRDTAQASALLTRISEHPDIERVSAKANGVHGKLSGVMLQVVDGAVAPSRGADPCSR